MTGYTRIRHHWYCKYSPSLRGGVKEHSWGGDNSTPGVPLTKQGTSFPGNAFIEAIQIVGEVTRAGSGGPGAEICSIALDKNDNTTGIGAASFVATTLGWKRGYVTSLVDANAQFDGEDYAATPDELQGRRDHTGSSTNGNITISFHGRFNGT
jgi:hypothetical protein